MAQKKRKSVGVTPDEFNKKKRKEDEVKSESPRTVKNKKGKKAKEAKEYIVKVKDAPLPDGEDIHDLPDEWANETHPWPQNDLIELFQRIESKIPNNDSLSYATRGERLDWEEISFGNYSPAECKKAWQEVQKRLRKFRLLKEMITDARQWLNKPWTNFYHGAKQNMHPDMPKRPLSTYMIYYMEKKDKVSQMHPNLEMTNVSKLIAEMYKNLSASKKEAYKKKAQALREEYQGRLRQFYEKHPELKEVKRSKVRAPGKITSGPEKPRAPFQIFLDEKLSKLKDSPNFDRTEVKDNAKAEWKALSDKKRLVWINWAVEEETKYQEALKLYMSENPNFQPPVIKSVLKKEEALLRDKAAGKPSKPPNSAYSMYSRIMLAKCPELRVLAPKDRMLDIARRWKEMSEADKAEYAKKVRYELDQYKLEYATYLESLPEEQREEELLKTQSKKMLAESAAIAKPNKSSKASKPKAKKVGSRDEGCERLYFPGEPRQPPVNAYELFVNSFVNDTKLSASEAPRYWDMLPGSDKAKFQKKLKELKEKYIRDYEKFLKSLDQEQLTEYNDLQKKNQAREAEVEKMKRNAEEDSSSEDDGNEEDEDDDDDDDDDDNEDDGDVVHNKDNEDEDDDSDSDEDGDTEKKSDSSSSSGSDTSSSSSSSSSSGDSDSSSDDSDDDGDQKNTNSVSVVKRELSDNENDSDA